MSYASRFLYSNDEMKLFSTTSGSWFTVDRKSGALSFISEQEAIEKVYTSVKDMELTCKIMNGGNKGSENEYNQILTAFRTHIRLIHIMDTSFSQTSIPLQSPLVKGDARLAALRYVALVALAL